MSERRWTGFTDKSDRPIYEGDVVSFRNDYPGSWDPPEPPEPRNDIGIVWHAGGQRGFAVNTSISRDNRMKDTMSILQTIEEFGDVEIISTPDAPDYDQYRKETP